MFSVEFPNSILDKRSDSFIRFIFIHLASSVAFRHLCSLCLRDIVYVYQFLWNSTKIVTNCVLEMYPCWLCLDLMIRPTVGLV
jgi:hypothetical protein